MIDMCGGDVGEASKYQGYLSATNAAATLFTAATLGLIADRWGRRTCLFISLVLSSSSSLIDHTSLISHLITFCRRASRST
jgi:MFS family permease